MSKVINAPTIDEVVSNLLIRLNQMVEDCNSAEELLQITESIAKLSSSMKSNDQFGKPLSEEEKAKLMEEEIFKNALGGNK